MNLGNEKLGREKRWFITEDNKSIRWVKIYIEHNIEYDDATTHLVVSMNNNLNTPTRVADCKIENIKIENFFFEKKDAQMEIIRRERFDK